MDTVDTFRTTLKATPSMKSVRFHGPGDIRVDEIDEPVCRSGEVKIRPAFVGICGSGEFSSVNRREGMFIVCLCRFTRVYERANFDTQGTA